jgi:hypothetical protein
MDATCMAAQNAQLKKLEPIHNQGLQIAIGALCINKTENLLCKAGISDLNHRLMIKAAITALKISSRTEHPMRTTLIDTEEYDNYAVRPRLTVSRTSTGCLRFTEY